jgi:hypothetical protein
MARVSRTKYHQATEQILRELKYPHSILKQCQFLINIDNRNIFIDIAGKQLPYYGSDGREGFAWETFIGGSRLDKIDKEAGNYGAEAWIAFCYEIVDSKFRNNFTTIVNLDGHFFGLKLIKTSEFRKYMKPRSASSWDVVDLPRDIVTGITCDPEMI